MKRIYYLQKHEVKIGDIVEYNGIKTVVTEELIELNPELFRVEGNIHPIYFKSLKGIKPFTTGRIYKQVDSIGYPITIKLIADDNKEWTVYNWQSNYLHLNNNCFELTTKEEWDKQEIMDIAIRNFPIGTKFKSGNIIQTVIGNEFKWHGNIIHVATDIFGSGGEIYLNGKFVEILPLKFTTEDGVDIYGDMKTYAICKEELILELPSVYGGNSPTLIYFYHKENALAYIKKHKEKTLEDYENILFERGNSMICSSGVVYFSVYGWLKDNEPKLYYTKIMQLIADDLNDGRYIHIRGNTSYHLSNAREVNVHCGGDEGCVYFKSRELAEKAKVILGYNINHLFN